MSEQIISKQCRTCKEIKSLSEFHKEKKGKDGLKNNCRTCRSKYHKEYSRTEKGKMTCRKARSRYEATETGKTYRQSEKHKTIQKASNKQYSLTKKGKSVNRKALLLYLIRHPERKTAMNAVNYAIRIGKLPRPGSLQCHYCPAQAKEYHHYNGYDPEHWLDVVPVCIKCHNTIPKKQVISAIV